VVDNQLMPFELTICGIEELACHCEAGVTHVLSILDPGWPEPQPLNTFSVNRRLKLRFHDIISPSDAMSLRHAARTYLSIVTPEYRARRRRRPLS